MFVTDPVPEMSQTTGGLGAISRLTQFLLVALVVLATALVDIARLLSGRRAEDRRRLLLAIESGIRGWKLIEYEELHRSACDYLGETHVKKVVVDDRSAYIANLRKSMKELHPTHYFYDPRTGRQEPWLGLWDSLQVAIVFRWYGVTPIAWLTDLPIRAWRRQCIVVTARSGVIVALMSARRMAAFIPHRRVVGPSLMAISQERLHFLDLVSREREWQSGSALFTGSLYEPRTSILAEIQGYLDKSGRSIQIQARSLNGERDPNDQYWSRLARAVVLLTTADQVSGKGIDHVGLLHLIFRYSEALAAGALLVAPEVPGIRRYFVPDVHFASYRTPKEAAEKIALYLDHPEMAEALASEGRARMSALIKSYCYWTTIDSALGKASLT